MTFQSVFPIFSEFIANLILDFGERHLITVLASKVSSLISLAFRLIRFSVFPSRATYNEEERVRDYNAVPRWTIANEEKRKSPNVMYSHGANIKGTQRRDRVVRLSSHRNFLRSGCRLTSQVFSSLEFGSGDTPPLPSFPFLSSSSCLA